MHSESTMNLPWWQSGTRAAETDTMRIRTAAQPTKKPDLILTVSYSSAWSGQPCHSYPNNTCECHHRNTKICSKLAHFCRQCLLCKSDDEYIWRMKRLDNQQSCNIRGTRLAGNNTDQKPMKLPCIAGVDWKYINIFHPLANFTQYRFVLCPSN